MTVLKLVVVVKNDPQQIRPSHIHLVSYVCTGKAPSLADERADRPRKLIVSGSCPTVPRSLWSITLARLGLDACQLSFPSSYYMPLEGA